MRVNAKYIKIKMAEQGLTRDRLAEKSNLNPSTITRTVKHGVCAPKTAGKLAQALGVPVAEVAE